MEYFLRHKLAIELKRKVVIRFGSNEIGIGIENWREWGCSCKDVWSEIKVEFLNRKIVRIACLIWKREIMSGARKLRSEKVEGSNYWFAQ